MDSSNARHSAPRALLGPVLAAVLLHAVLLTIYVHRHGDDAAALVCVGENRIGQPPYEAITRSIGSDGYDGQFYYALARNPWKRHTAGIDSPAARHLRLLYPAVCWLFSHGAPRLLIWIMPLVNLLAIGGLTVLGSMLAMRNGMNAWWGFTLPLAVTVGLPAMRNLTDPVSTCAVCGLVIAWLLGWPCWAVVLWAAAAIFSREQNLAIALLLLGTGLWQGRFRLAAAIGVVILTWLAWVSLLRSVYGTWPFLDGGGNFGLPLTGLALRWEQAVQVFTDPTRGRFGNAWSTFNLTLELSLVAGLLLARKSSGPVTMLLLAGAALTLMAGPAIYEEFWGYARVLVWLPLGVWISAVESRRTWLLFLLGPQMLWSLLAAARV